VPIRTRGAKLLALFAVFAVAGIVSPLAAQEGADLRKNVISANPFGLLLELFNAEYERVVSETSTAGVGGSTISADDDRYVNADVFWRYYPTGSPLNGWAFGVKTGITNVSDGTYWGYGFDVNRSWLLGRNNNFYVGIGFGLKRLIGASDQDFDLQFIPTVRLVNVGIAF
jgi:hypothetical protein